MRSLLLDQPWRMQPQIFTKPNPQGVAAGARLLFNPASGALETVRNVVWTKNGSASYLLGTYGRSLKFDGSGDSFSTSGYPELLGYGTFFAFFPVVGPPSPFGHIYLGSNSPGVMAYQIDNAGGCWIGSTNHGSIPWNSWFNSTFRSIAFVSGPTASQVRLYVDGKTALANGVAAGAQWGAGTKVLKLGGYPTGNNWDFQGQILVAGWVPWLWSEVDAQTFHTNPFSVYEPQKRRLWAVPTGGSEPTVYTLDADPIAAGSGALGSSARGVTRRLSAGIITASSSLQSVNLYKGLKLAAATIAGSGSLGNATVIRHRRLAAGEIVASSLLGAATYGQTYRLTADALSGSGTLGAGTITVGKVLVASVIAASTSLGTSSAKVFRRLAAEPLASGDLLADATLTYNEVHIVRDEWIKSEEAVAVGWTKDSGIISTWS